MRDGWSIERNVFAVRALLLTSLLLAAAACGSTPATPGGAAGHGGPGGPAAGAAGMPGHPGAAGAGGGSASTGVAGAGGISACVPGVTGPIVVDCGYPYTSGKPLTSVVFNESDVLRAIEPSGGAPSGTIRVFYNDEHALTLGVRQVVVKTATGPPPRTTRSPRLSPTPAARLARPPAPTRWSATRAVSTSRCARCGRCCSSPTPPPTREPRGRLAARGAAPRSRRRLRHLEGGGEDRRRDGDAERGLHNARRRPGEEQLEPRGRRPGAVRAQGRGLWRRGALDGGPRRRPHLPHPGHGARRRPEQGGRRLG